MNINKTFMILYLLSSFIVLSLLLTELFGIYSANRTMEIIFFNILLPLSFLFGAISYVTSYKKIIIKLIPPVVITFIIIIFEIYYALVDGISEGTGFVAIMAIFTTFLYLLGFSIITFIANFVVKMRQKKLSNLPSQSTPTIHP